MEGTQVNTTAGAVLVEKAVRFIEFVGELQLRVLPFFLPPPEQLPEGEERDALLALMTDDAKATNARMIANVKQCPESLIFQLASLAFMNNLDLCDRVFNSATADTTFFAELYANSKADADPMLAQGAAFLSSFIEMCTEEELGRLRRYLKFFIETTVGSDLAAARKRYEDNKDLYNKQAEAQLTFFQQQNGGASGHIGSEGVDLHEGGDREGDSDDEGRRGQKDSEEGKGKEVDRSEGQESKC
jgi:hypothetical protein